MNYDQYVKTIYGNNLSALSIINKAISRSNKPTNKYNEVVHQNTEELSGEVNDRVGFDCGMEMEKPE
jgi:hypothetical protein